MEKDLSLKIEVHDQTIWNSTPIALAHTSAEMAEAADFFLRSPTLTASNFAAL